MGNIIFDTVLHRVDAEQNMARYYSVSVQPNLFGGHSLLRAWGRIGTGGQIKVDLFDNAASAREHGLKVLLSKRQRGYICANLKDPSVLPEDMVC